jgi:hypothetical protein
MFALTFSHESSTAPAQAGRSSRGVSSQNAHQNTQQGGAMSPQHHGFGMTASSIVVRRESPEDPQA